MLTHTFKADKHRVGTGAGVKLRVTECVGSEQCIRRGSGNEVHAMTDGERRV